MSNISGFDIVFCIFVVLVMIITYKDLQQQIDQLQRCRDIELKRFSYLHGMIEAMHDKVEELYDTIEKDEPCENPFVQLLHKIEDAYDEEKESSEE